MNSRTPTLRSVKSIGDNSQVLLPMLRTKDNVVLVGLSQLLVELKHTLLLKRVFIILILLNNNLLIVILKVLDVMVVIRILLLVGLLRTVSLHKINIHTLLKTVLVLLKQEPTRLEVLLKLVLLMMLLFKSFKLDQLLFQLMLPIGLGTLVVFSTIVLMLVQTMLF